MGSLDSDQMSTSFGSGACEDVRVLEAVDTESRNVWTGVTCVVVVEELLDSAAVSSFGCAALSAICAPSSSSVPPFSLVVVESTGMSFPLKSSMMLLSAFASYAGDGRMELGFRLSRVVPDPGDVAPSAIELPGGEAMEPEPSPRSGVRSLWSRWA